MKNIAIGAAGAVIGALYVVIIGLLSVQVIGLQAGAVFDLGNTVVGITEPQVPIWPLLAIVVLSALVIVGLVVLHRAASRTAGVALIAGFALAAAVVVVWAFILAAGRDSGGEQTVGVLGGWVGWVEKGGLNSATHLVIVLAVASFWLPSRPQKQRTPEVGVPRTVV
jgi:hypothetical protein